MQEMTGIVILPAGRDDAFADYKQYIQDGHPIDDVEPSLDDDGVELFRTTSDDDRVHVWGTSVDGTWRNVEQNGKKYSIKRVLFSFIPIYEPSGDAIVVR